MWSPFELTGAEVQLSTQIRITLFIGIDWGTDSWNGWVSWDRCDTGTVWTLRQLGHVHEEMQNLIKII